MKKSPTVLVASDDAFELATLSAALRLHGINVVAEAHTEEIAQNLYKFLSPEVVLVDLQFAGEEALDLVNKFRKVNPVLGVVLMTACPDLRLLGLVEKQIPLGSQVILKKSVSDLSVVSLGSIATDPCTRMLFVASLPTSLIFKLKLTAYLLEV